MKDVPTPEDQATNLSSILALANVYPEHTSLNLTAACRRALYAEARCARLEEALRQILSMPCVDLLEVYESKEIARVALEDKP